MNPLDSVRIALSSLVGNKLRTFLTLLGIVIGVGAVIAVMSIGKGSQAAITSQIESIGTNLLFVRPGAATQDGVRQAQGSAATLTLEDANALGDPAAVPDVVAVSPEITTFGQVRAGSSNVNTRVTGVSQDYLSVHSYSMADGEFIGAPDVTSRTMVVVLGSNIAGTLFPGESPVDQTVYINNRMFRVKGVLTSKGGTALGLQDDVVLAPLTTVQARLVNQRTTSGRSSIQSITLQAASGTVIDRAKDQVAAVLRERHRIVETDDFTITTQQDVIATRSQVTNVLTIFLGSIAGISLLVGGIGVMNIMLVSVTERTREIGIRKAIGAKRRHILTQFLTEATTLSLTGGGLGVLSGWGASRLLEKVSLSNQQVKTLISPDVIILAVAVSVAIGLFFGIYPAMRASRLDPIEALRYE